MISLYMINTSVLPRVINIQSLMTQHCRYQYYYQNSSPSGHGHYENGSKDVIVWSRRFLVVEPYVNHQCHGKQY